MSYWCVMLPSHFPESLSPIHNINSLKHGLPPSASKWITSPAIVSCCVTPVLFSYSKLIAISQQGRNVFMACPSSHLEPRFSFSLPLFICFLDCNCVTQTVDIIQALIPEALLEPSGFFFLYVLHASMLKCLVLQLNSCLGQNSIAKIAHVTKTLPLGVNFSQSAGDMSTTCSQGKKSVKGGETERGLVSFTVAELQQWWGVIQAAVAGKSVLHSQPELGCSALPALPSTPLLLPLSGDSPPLDYTSLCVQGAPSIHSARVRLPA